MNREVYVSFLVRCWREQPGGEQHGCWHGEIEHIQSGTRWSFRTLTELLFFLQQAASAPDPAMSSGPSNCSKHDS